MKTDSLFYRFFKTQPGTFFELINQPISTADNYTFSSVEVKQTAFRLDGVFLPKQSDSDNPLYFVEVQFQPDEKLYVRLFSEIFLYLTQVEKPVKWFAVVIYPNRNLEPSWREPYLTLLNSSQVTRIYLSELTELFNESLGIATLKLIIESPKTAAVKAKELINKTIQVLTEPLGQKNLIELIETIIVYKFPDKTRKEIETMLGLGDLKQTKVYQEGLLEGKLKAVPLMLALGATVEQIAQSLELPEAEVRKIAQQSR